MFTEEEIKTAIKVRDMIISGEMPDDLKSIYMAGEIVMNEEIYKKIIPDIKNKLSPVSNLIAMLESSELIYHHKKSVHNIIVKEIEQCKKSIEYLSNLKLQ